MSKRRPFLKSLLATTLLLVIVVILLFTLDLGRFKGFIEAQVSAAAGYEFSINGDLSIHLGRTIDISASGLRMANPDWADHPDQARIAEFEASIDLRSLVSGPVIIESMKVNDAVLLLAVSPEGEKSWQTPGSKPPVAVLLPQRIQHRQLAGIHHLFGQPRIHPVKTNDNHFRPFRRLLLTRPCRLRGCINQRSNSAQCNTGPLYKSPSILFCCILHH